MTTYFMKDVKDVRAPRPEGSTSWLVGATILAFGVVASAAIYSGRKNARELGFTPAVSQALEPRRERFDQVCQERTPATLYDGSLGRITKGRDEYLRSFQYDGGCERWLCERVITEDDNQQYKARYLPIGSLECNF